MICENDESRKLKILSVLLRYPEDDLIEAMPELGRAFLPLSGTSAGAAVDRFLSWAVARPPLAVQERYTEAFDLNPATSLDLTYHIDGDTEDRGRSLCRLRQVYRRAGYVAATAELPDHLPMVLEFLSLATDDRSDVLDLCTAPARTLADRLRSAKSPYAGLVGCAASLMAQMAGAGSDAQEDCK